VDDDQDASQRINAESDESLLAFSVRVFDRHRERISQRLLSIRKTYAMLAKIRLGLGGIELDIHVAIMHILCILSMRAYAGGGQGAITSALHTVGASPDDWFRAICGTRSIGCCWPRGDPSDLPPTLSSCLICKRI